MKLEEKCLRWTGIVVAIAVTIRLLSGGIGEQIWNALSSPKTAAALLFLETGRHFHAPSPTTVPETIPQTTLSPETAPTEETTLPPATEPELPVFAPEDRALVAVNSRCKYDADVPEMLAQPLSWDLTGGEPKVLIFHSHATESYRNTENYTQSAPYRTLSADYNMVSVGAHLKSILEDAGIGVIHDTTLYDHPSYNDSYGNARQGVQELLNQYPTVELVLDLHRDSLPGSSGEEVALRVETPDGASSQLMMVVGTDASGLNHPMWLSNLSLAVKLHARLEQIQPGLCRPISLRKERFNQDLSTGAMLIEIGAAGNDRQEALLAATYLGYAIIDLAQGCTTADSAS